MTQTPKFKTPAGLEWLRPSHQAPRTEWNDRDYSQMELTEALAYWRDHHNAASRDRAFKAISYFREYHLELS